MITLSKKLYFFQKRFVFGFITLCFFSLSFLINPVFAQHKAPVVDNINNLPSGNSDPDYLVPIGTQLFFSANNGVDGIELYKNTGVIPSTMIKDIRIPGSSSPIYTTDFSGIAYFFANNPADGVGSLWRSDGTNAGTVLVRRVRLLGGSNARYLTKIGSRMFFAANDGTAGQELWVSNGTTIGTNLLKDINPGAGNSFPDNFTMVGSKLFFLADDGTGSGPQLWVSDGTAVGTQLVINLGALAFTNGIPSNKLIEKDGECYFVANDGGGLALWRSDGTAIGTTKIVTLGFSSNTWINAGGILYFGNADGNGVELWKSDGTVGGTQMVRDIFPGAGGSNPDNFAVVNGTLYFAADGTSGIGTEKELWQSDGTVGGTTLVADLNATIGSNPKGITQVNNKMYFIANGDDCGVNKGEEIWFYDPSKAVSNVCPNQNPKLYYDVNPSGDGTIARITTFGTNNLAFTADNGDGATGNELWIAEPCPDVQIAYVSSSLCNGSGNVTPSVLPVVPGGTYSAPVGIIFVDSGTNIGSLTGEINLATSTIGGPYTITYELAGGFQGCEVKATFDLVITGGSVSNTRTTETYLSSGFSFDATGTGGPGGMVLNPNGTILYITDQLNGRVQSVNFTTGVVANANFISGLNNPTGVAVDPAGNVYVVERGSQSSDGTGQIRKYSNAGALLTTYTNANLQITGEAFAPKPYDLAIDFNGTIYFTDQFNHRVKKIDASVTTATLLAGSGTAGAIDGTGAAASFDNPIGISISLDGNTLYISERNPGNKIRTLNTSGTVGTLSGSTQGYTNGINSGARFNSPRDVTIDPTGNIYVADRSNNVIRKVASGQTTTDAGPATFLAGGYVDGFGSAVRFNNPTGIFSDLAGNIFVVDASNNRIRRVYSDNSAGRINGSRGVCRQANPALALTLTNMSGGAIPGANISKWQSSIDFGVSWQDIAGTNGLSTYNIAANSPTLTQTIIFRAIVFSGGCSAPSNFATIVVYNLSPPVANPPPASVCSASTTPVTISATGGTAGNYRWYRDAAGTQIIVGAVNASYTFTPATVIPALTTPITTFYVGITSATCGSVSPLVPIDVPVVTTPVNPTATGKGCGTGAVTLTATGATGATQYLWYDDAGGTNLLKTSVDASDNTFITPSISTNTTYYLRAANGTCTSGLVAVIANVYANPTPVISGDPIVCENALAIPYSTPAVGGHTYAWVVTGGTIASGQGTAAITVNWGAAGAGTISLTQTSAAPGSCPITTADYAITINGVPAPVITGVSNSCLNTAQVYSTPDVVGHTFTWTVTNGTVTAGAGTSSITVNWTGPTPGTVSVEEAVAGSTTCRTTATLTPVNLFLKPTPNISAGATSVCANDVRVYSTTNVGGNTYAWVVTGGTINSGQGTASINVTWTTIGAGDVSLTETSGTGCETIVNLPVTISEIPAPVITGVNTSCLNTDQVYSTPDVAGHTFTWTVTNGTITAGAGTSSITVNWTGPTPGTVSVQEAVAASPICATTATLTPINLFLKPTPNISAGATSVCANDIRVYSTTNVGGNTYVWVVTGGTINSGQGTASINVTWTTVGAGDVSLTETSGTGCETIVNLPVTINPIPAPVISGLATPCAFSQQTYSTPFNAGNTYNWSVIGGTFVAGAGLNEIIVTWGAGPAGTVNVTEQTVAGCSTVATVYNVTITPSPAPVITGILATCVNTSPIYSTPLNPGNTYTWAVTGGTITAGAGTNQITVNWTTPGTQSITLTEGNGTCNTVATPISVNVEAVPAPVISGFTTLCRNAIGITYSTPATANTLLWTVMGGVIASGQGTATITVNWGAGASGTVQVQETTPSTTCQTTTPLYNITLLAPPTPVVTSPQGPSGSNFCQRNVYTFQTALVAGHEYTWSVAGGSILTGQATNQISVLWGSGGAGIVNVIEKITATDCQVQSTDYIANLLVSPTPDVTGTILVCENSTGLNYQTTNNVGNTYSWTIVGGTITSASNTPTVTVSWGAGGQGLIIVRETNPSLCPFIDTLSVTINPLPTASTVRNGLRCSAGQVKLIAKYPNAISYNWYDSGMNFLVNQTDTLFLTPVISSGVQTFYVEAITAPNCVGVRTAVTATISPVNIEATVVERITNICGRVNNGAIDITVTNGQVPYTYTWRDASGNVVANTEDLTNLAIGNYTVTIVDDGNCTTVKTYSIIEDFTQVANVDAGPNTSMVRGETITLNATGTDAVSFKWTTIPARSINAFSDPNSASPEVSLDTTSILIVEVTNNLGCIGLDSLVVEVADFFVPNTFSPNNDGQNETFQVFGNRVQELEIKIFDRLGALIYENKDKDQIMQVGWDGISKGTPAPPGNYIWQIKGKFENGNDVQFRGKTTGNVILIR